MKELKDYSILDIEAIDDERFKKEKAPGKWVPESRVYLKDDVDAVIAGLKAALKESEDARYEAGADAADYYQEIRRLKRALWIARANSARNKVRFFGWAFDCYDIDTLINIDGHKYKMPRQNRLLVCHHWIEIFENVEQLCKAKADEYK